MKKMFAAIILALPLSATSVLAADSVATPQQNRMAACSKENKGLKGEEYKTAQQACLAKDAAPANAKTASSSKVPAENTEKPASQQNKMAACSKANKGLKGEEFKLAQKECLSK